MPREAMRSDLATIAEIERSCFPHDALPMIAFVQYFDLFGATFLVEEREGAIDGFVIAGAAASAAHEAWILDVAVAPDARGRGTASRLIEAALQKLSAARARVVRATIAPENDRSLALFTRAGFEIERTVDDYFGPGERRHVVRRTLAA